MTPEQHARKIESDRKRRQADPRKALASFRSSTSGYKSVYEFMEAEDRHGGRCAICGSDNKGKTLYSDHHHGNGKPRGFLCAGCNTKVGAIESDKFKACLAYVRKWEKIHAAEDAQPEAAAQLTLLKDAA